METQVALLTAFIFVFSVFSGMLYIITLTVKNSHEEEKFANKLFHHIGGISSIVVTVLTLFLVFLFCKQ